MTAPATYGELLAEAHRHAFRAHIVVQRNAFPDAVRASGALAARGRLLSAVADHAVMVLGPLRVATWAAGEPTRRSPDTRTPIVQAVVTWIRETRNTAETTGPASLGSRQQSPGAARSAGEVELDAACEHIRAATDLIATHRGPAGHLRTGAPFALAGGDLGGLLARVVDVADIAAGTEPWAVRVREAGLSRAQVDEALPIGSPLRVRTRDLATLLGDPRPALDEVTVARPAITAGDPAAEWRLRTDRIRARIEQHALAGRASARTVHDVASLGLIVSYVLTTSGVRTTDTPGMDPRSWLPIVEHLAPLRSAEPADRTIRADVQRLLEIAHPQHTADRPAQQARLLVAIDASVPTLAACHDATGRLLAGMADAWIPARRLPTYLRNPTASGHAARPAPPCPVAWPTGRPEAQSLSR